MSKTLVDIDDDLLARAAEHLGTATKKDTVNAALAMVVRAAAFERTVAFAQSGGFDDLLDPEVMRAAWR